MQFPELNTRDRLIVTGSGIFLFFLVQGVDVLDFRIGFRLSVTFLVGLLVSVWAGHETIGSFPPLSVRPAFILLGILMMSYSFIMMLLVRGALER